MASLRDLVRAVQQDLPITVRHDRWLSKHSHGDYSPSALVFMNKAMTNQVGGGRARKQGFRASGMGSCQRKRVFSYIGHPGIHEQIDSKLSNIFFTGHYYHLKWQMIGLTEGYLTEAEVPFHSDEHNLGGTADGLIYDGSLFELKSINNNGFRQVSDQGPKWDHLLQTGSYKLLKPDLTAVSIVYENKDTGEWREFRRSFSGEVMDAVEIEVAALNNAVKDQKLPDIKPGCLAKQGIEYRTCPFRDSCLKIKTWPKAAA